VGVSIITPGRRVLSHPTLQCSIDGDCKMFAQAMNHLDRAAMTFVVVLAAMPILSIAARAAFL